MPKKDYHNVLLLVPEPFFKAWQALISLCQTLKGTDPMPDSHPHWPIHALGIKASTTTLAIASLAAMRLWEDALILGRSLFETEIMVKWLLESETEARIAEYLSEIDDEESRVLRKTREGISVLAQIIRDLFPEDNSEVSRDQSKRRRPKSAIPVRERARRLALERSYDFGYWFASVFAHSHALSLSQWNPALIADKSPLTLFFGAKDKALPSWTVLEALPMHALDTIQLVDFHFNLGLAQDVENTRERFRDIIRQVSHGVVQFTSEIERGQVQLVRNDGAKVTYTPKKSGCDPVDGIFHV